MTSLAGHSSDPLNVMDLPIAGRFLRWRHARTALQLPLLGLAVLMVFDGLVGPQLAPKNLATVFTWIHYRGLVVLALLLAGNLLCMACPFMLVRNLARRLAGTRAPARMWPSRLRRKWLSLFLFAALLFAYEFLDLWAAPRWTAYLILTYFAAALAVDSFFRGATFCKYLCPLGHFNFVASLVSPLEVKVRDLGFCHECRTKDCIKGRPVSRTQSASSPISGCQLWLFQPRKSGNMDCTFCLDCAHACPYANVGLEPRLPASELWVDPQRSGIGRFSRRPDLAALVALVTFGALLNAFAMVRPVYLLEERLASLLGTRSEVLVLGSIFLAGLVVLPLLLLASAGWISRWFAGATEISSLLVWTTRFAYALVPLGFGVWLAHYGFHFLTGFWTFVPVTQSFVADVLGMPLLGAPRWELGPLLPAALLALLEVGFLGLGWFGSLLVAYRMAEQHSARQPWRAFLPWAVLLSLLLAAAMWLMGQPMEMRGTFLVG